MNAVTRKLNAICMAFVLVLVTGNALAAVFKNAIIAGDQSQVIQRTVELAKGTYTLQMLDIFHLGENSDAQVVLLIDGDTIVAALDFPASAGLSSAEFTLDSKTVVKLFVDSSKLNSHGPVIVSIVAENEKNPTYREVFNPEASPVESANYEYSYNIAVDSQQLRLELTDFGAFFGVQLQNLTPFDSVTVQILNSSSSTILNKWCWYVGTSSDVGCEPMGASSESMLTLDQILQIEKGYLSVYISANAPANQLAQIGWQISSSIESGVDLSDLAIVNKVPAAGIDIGEFTLSQSTVVDCQLIPVSLDISSFQLAIASSNGTVVDLDNETMTASTTLPPGNYRILMLAEPDEKGLLGLIITAGSTVLFDDAFSLGDYQELGEFSLAEAATVPVKIHNLDGKNDVHVFRVGGGSSEVLVDGLNPERESVELAKAHHTVWFKYIPDAADNLFRLTVGESASPLLDVYGTSNARAVSHDVLSLLNSTLASVSLTNFKFPDEFDKRFSLLVAQGDMKLLKIDFDSNSASEVANEVSLQAGDVHVLVFAEQSENKATVLGYRVDSGSATNSPDETPGRGANGSGGHSGGGSFNSFVLYCLLVFKFVRRRVRS